MQKEKASTGL